MLYLDELVFTVRQPWCRIHVPVCRFLSAVGNVMGVGAITAGPWRGLCVSEMYCAGLQFLFSIPSSDFADFS